MNRAVIEIGSNIEPEKNTQHAKNLIEMQYAIIQETQFIKTRPIGPQDQDDFLNGSILVETDCSFEEFKTFLKNIEKELGRKDTRKTYGPRPIDLDIIVWNGKIISQDFYNRNFVKNATLELWPGLKF